MHPSHSSHQNKPLKGIVRSNGFHASVSAMANTAAMNATLCWTALIENCQFCILLTCPELYRVLGLYRLIVRSHRGAWVCFAIVRRWSFPNIRMNKDHKYIYHHIGGGDAGIPLHMCLSLCHAASFISGLASKGARWKQPWWVQSIQFA